MYDCGNVIGARAPEGSLRALYQPQVGTALPNHEVWWCCSYNAVILSHKHSQKTAHSSLVKARYGLIFFVDPTPDWYSASVLVMI